MSPNFSATGPEHELISDIVGRAENDLVQIRSMPTHRRAEFSKTLMMDLTAVNNTTPLNLKILLEFPPFDFAHDVIGIYNHIDRDTGKLELFSPRSARSYHPELRYLATVSPRP